MIKVQFILPDGSKRTVEAEPGTVVKDAAVINLIPGILAHCGGTCSCGTCHVHVGEQWRERFPALTPEEDQLLDGAATERRPDSRLSCQLPLSASVDGVVITIAERQE